MIHCSTLQSHETSSIHDDDKDTKPVRSYSLVDVVHSARIKSVDSSDLFGSSINEPPNHADIFSWPRNVHQPRKQLRSQAQSNMRPTIRRSFSGRPTYKQHHLHRFLVTDNPKYSASDDYFFVSNGPDHQTLKKEMEKFNILESPDKQFIV